MMAEPGLDCRICGAAALDELHDFARLRRVTSDCKPFDAGGRLAVCRECAAVQKPTDQRWREETASIYGAYQIYFQSGGVEQAVFDLATGAPRRRSAVLLDRLASCHPIAEMGTLVDIGCGSGALLSAFAELRPKWRLHGHDLSEINLAALSRIPGFQRLYTGPIEGLPVGFDIVTLIHSLEHLTQPFEALTAIRAKLGSNGCLLIEVPDVEANPFDLLVADHVSHFTRQDLARLVSRASYPPAMLANDWVVKELSVVAGPTFATAAPRPFPPPEVHRRVRAQIDWLYAVIEGGRRAAEGSRSFGLFGTSIAAMWLLGELGDLVQFFVDEDPSRAHGRLFGRPILRPNDVTDGATVFVPLVPQVARTVAGRLSGGRMELRLPPDLSAR
jgi:SAM-dependent methyltransferase